MQSNSPQQTMEKEFESITKDPDILGGMPVITGTRVPADTLIDYFREGFTIDDFLRDFPGVEREAADKVLASIKAMLGGSAEIR